MEPSQPATTSENRSSDGTAAVSDMQQRYSLLVGANPHDAGFNEFLPRDLERRSQSAHARANNDATSRKHAEPSTFVNLAIRDPRLYDSLNNQPHRARFLQYLTTVKPIGTYQPSLYRPTGTPDACADKVVNIEQLCEITAAVFKDKRYEAPKLDGGAPFSGSRYPAKDFSWAANAVDVLTGTLKAEPHSKFVEEISRCMKDKQELDKAKTISLSTIDRLHTSRERERGRKALRKRRNALKVTDYVKRKEVQTESTQAIDRMLDYWRNIDGFERPAWDQDLSAIKRNPNAIFNANAVASILDCAPLERTPQQLEVLMMNLPVLSSFAKLSDFMLSQLGNVVYGLRLPKNRFVFRQGEEGSSWYVIIKGSVSVSISKNPNSDDPLDRKVVTTLKTGEGFGELALVNDQPRAATITTLDDCVFARVDKADYNRIVKFVHYIDSKEKSFLLRKISCFEHWDDDKIRSATSILKWKEYEAGEILLAQGDVITEIQFLRTGKCAVFHAMKTDEGEEACVQIGTLDKFDYFGEEAVLVEAALGSNAKRTSSFTVQALAPVRVASFSLYDAQVKFKQDLRLSAVTQIALRPIRIQRKFQENKQQESWDAFRKTVTKTLYQETKEEKEKKALLSPILAGRPKWK